MEVIGVAGGLVVDVGLMTEEMVHVVNAGVSVLTAMQIAEVGSGGAQGDAVVTTQVSAAVVEESVIMLSVTAGDSVAILPSCEVVALLA